MALLKPDLILRRITELTPEPLEAQGIRALFLDVDNTLTTHNNPIPDKSVLRWLDTMKDKGMKLVLVSNNKGRRVSAFGAELGLPYTAWACKPLPLGFRRAAKELGLRPKQVAVVGDQLFTDILGGNLYGAFTVLVDFMEAESGPFFRLKRRAERWILNR